MSNAPKATPGQWPANVDMNDLFFEIQGSTDPVTLLMKYLPAARDGDAAAQYRIATILKLCIVFQDNRADTEKLLRSSLETSTSSHERGKYQGLIDRCSPVWRLPASESGERTDWLQRSADAGFVPAMLDAATDMGIEQSLEQRNARIQQALESRTAYVASAVAVSLYLDHVVPNGNLLDSLLYVQPAAMRGLLAGCELGDDCSMDSAAVKAYCQQYACPPAEDLIDLFSRQMSPAELREAQQFARGVVADLQAGRIKADMKVPQEHNEPYRYEFARDSEQQGGS